MRTSSIITIISTFTLHLLLLFPTVLLAQATTDAQVYQRCLEENCFDGRTQTTCLRNGSFDPKSTIDVCTGKCFKTTMKLPAEGVDVVNMMYRQIFGDFHASTNQPLGGWREYIGGIYNSTLQRNSTLPDQGSSTLTNQHNGTPTTQGDGTPTARGNGTRTTQGSGTRTTQGSGTRTTQGSGTPTAQGPKSAARKLSSDEFWNTGAGVLALIVGLGTLFL